MIGKATKLERDIYAHHGGPPPALLMLDGKAGKIVRPAKVFVIPSPHQLMCRVCDYPLGFNRKGEGGKSSDIYKMKRWWLECSQCGHRVLIPRPERIA